MAMSRRNNSVSRPVRAAVEGQLFPEVKVPDWRKELQEKDQRRSRFWSRFCWVWFLVGFFYLWANNRRAQTPGEFREIQAEVKQVMGVATAPLMVRGLWHRIRSGQ